MKQTLIEKHRRESFAMGGNHFFGVTKTMMKADVLVISHRIVFII